MLAGLLLYVSGRELAERDALKGILLMLIGLGAGAALGALCKRNAVLIIPFALCIELFFFKVQHLADDKRRLLVRVRAVILLLPLLLAAAYIGYKWDWLQDTYTIRLFSMEERLLTEARILFFYVGLMLLPHIESDVLISR